MRSSIVLLLLCSPAIAAPPTPGTPAPGPASIYRFDVSVTGIDAAPATYTMIVAEDRQSKLRSGPNIAYPAGGSSATQREQLGMELELSYSQHAGVLLVEGDFGMTSLVPSAGTSSPTWEQLQVRDLVAPVTPGKPTLLTSVYDIATHRRYEVTITAQRLI